MPGDEPHTAASRVSVIGGGIAGLVAARELANSGLRVTVHEAGAGLGGRIRQETVGGVTVEVGAESFATRGGAVAELIAELGASSAVVAPDPRGSWVVSPTRALPLPPAGSLGIPADPLSRRTVRTLGLPGALRAAIEPLLPRNIGARAENLADLVRLRLGARTLDRLVRPIALGVYSADPAELPLSRFPDLTAAYARHGSLLRASRELRGQATAAGGAVAGMRGGLGAIVDTLASQLADAGVEIRLEEPVDRLTSPDGAWLLAARTGVPLGRADAVLIAAPERQARQLLQADPPAAAEVQVEVVVLVIDDARLDTAPRGTGALVTGAPDAADPSHATWVRAKALTHATAKWEDLAERAPAGTHVVRLSYGSAGAPPATTGLDDADVQRLALHDASRILGIGLSAQQVRGMTRAPWRFGAPGGARSANDLAWATESAARLGATAPLAFAGDWVSGTGLASVVPGARAAARDLAARLADPHATASAADTGSGTHADTQPNTAKEHEAA